MTAAFLKHFQGTTASQAPALMGGLGQGGPADAFAARFGTSWRRTPVKGTWALFSDGVQFTVRVYPDGELDIAMYSYATVKEFKSAFETASTLSPDCFFQFPGTSKCKYPYLLMLEKMAELG